MFESKYVMKISILSWMLQIRGCFLVSHSKSVQISRD